MHQISRAEQPTAGGAAAAVLHTVVAAVVVRMFVYTPVLLLPPLLLLRVQHRATTSVFSVLSATSSYRSSDRADVATVLNQINATVAQFGVMRLRARELHVAAATGGSSLRFGAQLRTIIGRLSTFCEHQRDTNIRTIRQSSMIMLYCCSVVTCPMNSLLCFALSVCETRFFLSIFFARWDILQIIRQS